MFWWKRWKLRDYRLFSFKWNWKKTHLIWKAGSKFRYKNPYVSVGEKNDKHEFGGLSIYENSYEVTKKEIRGKWKIEICKKFKFIYENGEGELTAESLSSSIIKVFKNFVSCCNIFTLMETCLRMICFVTSVIWINTYCDIG